MKLKLLFSKVWVILPFMSLTSCITHNVVFIPVESNHLDSSFAGRVRTQDFSFECFAPYYRDDELVIVNYINWNTQHIKINHQFPTVFDNGDTITLRKIENRFIYKDIKKVKELKLHLKYSIANDDEVNVIEDEFLLRRKKNYFFTIH